MLVCFFNIFKNAYISFWLIWNFYSWIYVTIILLILLHRVLTMVYDNHKHSSFGHHPSSKVLQKHNISEVGSASIHWWQGSGKTAIINNYSQVTKCSVALSKGSIRVGAFQDPKTLCFHCTLDNGQSPKQGSSAYFQFYARNNYLITMGILRFYSYARRNLTQKVVFLCSIFSCVKFASLKQISANIILKTWAAHIHQPHYYILFFTQL